MNLETYLEEIKQFAVYPKKHELEYLKLGLLSEIGEVAGVLKKRLRGDYCQFVEVGEGEFGTLYRGAGDEPFKQDLTKEVGDCFWYWGMILNLEKTRIKCTEVEIKAPHPTETSFTLFDALSYWANYLDVEPNHPVDYECHSISTWTETEVWIALMQFINYHNLDLETILQTNIDKLTDRKNRNKIKGSGDER